MDMFALSDLFAIAQVALLLAGVYLTASTKNDESKRVHRAFGWMLQGLFFCTLSIWSALDMSHRIEWYFKLLPVFTTFGGGIMFGIGASRLFPEQGQLRTYFSRKLLGS